MNIEFLLFCMFASVPLIICDMYYAYTDDTCVQEHVDGLSINLKDYLLVCGWYGACSFVILSIGFCFCDLQSIINQKDKAYKVGNILGKIFLTIWNILGAVIFWKLMDTSDCSDSIYNYVFISLIIKLVSTAVNNIIF